MADATDVPAHIPAETESAGTAVVEHQQASSTVSLDHPVPSSHPPGTARIKTQFLVSRPHKRPITAEQDPATADAEFEESHESKRARVHNDGAPAAADAGARKSRAPKRGGQNKNRARTRAQDEINLCSGIAVSGTCSHGDGCRFSHDVAAYLAAKEPDLGATCPVFELFGRCRFGIKCRFAGAHTAADGSQIVDAIKVAEAGEYGPFLNSYTRDWQKIVRSRNLPTPKSDLYFKWLEVAKARRVELHDGVYKAATIKQTDVQTPAATIENETGMPAAAAKIEPPISDQPAVVAADDEAKSLNSDKAAAAAAAIKKTEEKKQKAAARQKILDELPHDPATLRFRCDEKPRLNFRGKTYLAPLTTVGNLPFRRICKDYGVDITCGEMAMCTTLLQGQQSEWALTRRHASEDIFGVQIAGANVRSVLTTCELINTMKLNVDFVDLNLGCPVDAICQKGSGAALLDGGGSKLFDICAGATYVLEHIPFTVKIRMGVHTAKPIAEKLVPRFAEAGVSMVSLHGRSKEQRYTKYANWDYIYGIGKNLRDANSNMTFFGNGDVLSHDDYWRHLDTAAVDGCMIGRGALIKPWIFNEIKERRVWDISSSERFDMLKKFANYGLEYWGSDTQGVHTTRRFLLEMQSFTHRYIPVGLLEVLPQKMNERPPPFVGRDELETLMASPDSEDWVKITERILGKTPESFKFVPKHKSNSYDTQEYQG
ncbi:tRNA-dihydrouridine(47) synthase [NAD(P)(+)]-like protein [Geranomyces variabilis]|uniref:tRNA-dihydrouridine(47) synthase [NAD(P)(+)] n=1 Tax=Geranomyces variabilis TaxID=109894 RepID=A0AAD5XSZ3_9FUNG|nr:tRNA-dihydrouridine(47) synthase [NAD(P)(+)]-like protein [Geranomyces variabilis]